MSDIPDFGDDIENWSGLDNLRRLATLLGDENFMDALENADHILRDTGETLDRVEMIEREVSRVSRNLNDKLVAVEGSVRVAEMRLEASIAAVLFIFGFSMYIQDNLLYGAAFGAGGLIFVVSLLSAYLSGSGVSKAGSSSGRGSSYR